MPALSSSRAALILLVLGGAACDRSPTRDEARNAPTTRASTSAAQPATLTKVSGDGQTPVVGTRTDSLLKVVVRDASGNPVNGVNVTFAADRAGSFYTYNPSTTGLRGIANVYFVPRVVGVTTVTASVPGLAPVQFTVTARAAQAAALAKVSGDSQTTRLGTRTDSLLKVVVRDAWGNPVNGVNVTFAADRDGVFHTFNPSTTGLRGIANVYFVPRTRGVTTVTASVPGLAPVRFTVNTPYGIKTVYLVPKPLTLKVGEVRRLGAVSYDSTNSSVWQAPEMFTSRDPSIVSVVQLGLGQGSEVTGRAVGQAYVDVRSESARDSLLITVTAP